MRCSQEITEDFGLGNWKNGIICHLTNAIEVSLAGAWEGYQDSVLNMLSIRRLPDMQWEHQATECVNLEFRGNTWARDKYSGAISI